MRFLGLLGAAALLSWPMGGAFADDVRTVVVKFPAGSTGTTISGKIKGRDSVNYVLGARKGQFLKVGLTSDNGATNYNIYVPGKGPGDEALFTSDLGGMDYTGQLYLNGNHTISVFLYRNAARRGEVGNYKLSIDVTDSAPVAEAAPSGGADQATALEQACLAAVSQETNNGEVVVLSSEFSEANTAVVIGVGPNQAPWRCLVSNDGVVAEVMSLTDEGAL